MLFKAKNEGPVLSPIVLARSGGARAFVRPNQASRTGLHKLLLIGQTQLFLYMKFYWNIAVFRLQRQSSEVVTETYGQ